MAARKASTKRAIADTSHGGDNRLSVIPLSDDTDDAPSSSETKAMDVLMPQLTARPPHSHSASRTIAKKEAWGHTAHRGWARLLLDRARDLIINGSAHRGANGVAMPTDSNSN